MNTLLYEFLMGFDMTLILGITIFIGVVMHVYRSGAMSIHEHDNTGNEYSIALDKIELYLYMLYTQPSAVAPFERNTIQYSIV